MALFKELKTVPNIFTMESSFAGVDFGDQAGQHFSTQMFETIGKDLCRCILVYQNIYVPSELKDLPFFRKTSKNIERLAEEARKLGENRRRKRDAPDSQKTFDDDKDFSIRNAFMEELLGDTELLKAGEGDSSSGSDSAPSDDNLTAEVLVKNLPVADKVLKTKLKKEIEKKKEE